MRHAKITPWATSKPDARELYLAASTLLGHSKAIPLFRRLVPDRTCPWLFHLEHHQYIDVPGASRAVSVPCTSRENNAIQNKTLGKKIEKKIGKKD